MSERNENENKNIAAEIVAKAEASGHLRQKPYGDRMEAAFDAIVEPSHPLPDATLLLYRCPHCDHHGTHKAYDITIDKNIVEGSRKAPLRAKCPECKKFFRLRSEERDNVLAAVPHKRIIQRNNLKQLAEELNLYHIGEGKLPARIVAYRLWNQICDYPHKGKMPMPFRRWIRRVEQEAWS